MNTNEHQTTNVAKLPPAPTPTKVSISADNGKIVGLVPRTIDEAARLANGLALGGDMVPAQFQGKSNQILAAVLRGMEVGLAPMQSLSSICVINGRASLWGDAIPALMQRGGHQIDVEVEGEGDTLVATATLIRGDTGQKIVRTFSAADAKLAGLWNKKGPWQQYPRRMVSMRARTWAARDGAADALMGLQVVEEVQDYTPIKDVTPKQSGFSQSITDARTAHKTEQAPAVDEQGTPPEPEKPLTDDAQGATTTDQGETTHQPTENSEQPTQDPSQEFSDGALGFESDFAFADCPFEPSTKEGKDWMLGWKNAEFNSQQSDGES